LAWGRRNYANYPWRSEHSPWLALSAEVLLQRTRADQVVPVYERFRSEYPEAAALATESVHGLLEVIGPLGLRWRAPLMIKMASVVADRGGPPDDPADLIRLPGVGPYAAAAYLSFHRSKRAVIIDSNVVRWLGRLVGQQTDGETRRKQWLIGLADALTPVRVFRGYNYAVLDFAMNVCTLRPACDACPLSSGLCVFPRRRVKRVQH
jgi:A/G-specific adenine glycosylase